MNGLMIKALAFAAILMVATVYVIMKLDMDVMADSVTAITVAAALFVAAATAYVSVKYINQMKTDVADGEKMDEEWDGVSEYKNELPSGWAYSFLAAFIWSMWYGLWGYPVNEYTQIGEYNEEVLAYNKKFEATHANADKETLQKMGESIYLVQCSQCHGATGDGLSGKAEDLTAGYSAQRVEDIINNGQNEMLAFEYGMPGAMASGDDVKVIAEYVASGFVGTQPEAYGSCTGCHGADGEGVPYAGPRINGYDLSNTLAHGKKGKMGMMPAFSSLITPVQEKALGEYIKTINVQGAM